MKIKFTPPKDNKRHRYCQNCYSENVRNVERKGKVRYECEKCGNSYERLIDLDPRIKWWVDKKTKEYWHEGVGVFVVYKNKILLFERTIYPYAYTIPAGHLDINETPDEAAVRELKEETSISLSKVNPFKVVDIANDKCRKGADYHKWHLYTALLDKLPSIKIQNTEGHKGTWVKLSEALKLDLTLPVRFFLRKYNKELLKLMS